MSNNTNRFILDLAEAKPYEILGAELLDGSVYETTGNDYGIDVIKDKMFIDVKAFRRPSMQNFAYKYHHPDLLLEIGNGSGGCGWLNNPEKKTTHYLFFTDCGRNENWFEAFLVEKHYMVDWYNKNKKNARPASYCNGYVTCVKIPKDYVEKCAIRHFTNDAYYEIQGTAEKIAKGHK